MLNTQGSSWKGRDAEPVICSQDWEQIWLIACCPLCYLCGREYIQSSPNLYDELASFFLVSL